MALFFDAAWFDEKLSERGLSRAVMAAVAGLDPADLALVLKDQREVSAGQVAAFAELLGVPAAEIADRAGVSTPTPRSLSPADARLDALERRVADLEARLARLSPE
ncbi:MAG: helix-turn-helix domain-containing protein [Pseudomonadota bacterium]